LILVAVVVVVVVVVVFNGRWDSVRMLAAINGTALEFLPL